MALELEKKRLVRLGDAAQALRLGRLDRGERAMAPAPRLEAADGHVGTIDDLRKRSSRGEVLGVSASKLRLCDPGEGRAGLARDCTMHLSARETIKYSLSNPVGKTLDAGLGFGNNSAKNSPPPRRHHANSYKQRLFLSNNPNQLLCKLCRKEGNSERPTPISNN